MNTFDDCISILTGPEIYLDHLGVLSELLNIPLIVTEESTLGIAKEFYPNLNVIHKDISELTLDYLASNYNSIFHTSKYWMSEIDPLLRLIHKKSMRFVFCPHGNSDKEASLKNHVKQDISLYYGEHMLRQLNDSISMGIVGFTCKTGNYRYEYFKKNEIFYKKLLLKRFFTPINEEKKTIFYAPSWDMKTSPSSFFQHFEKIANSLKKSFNLIVKIHPLLEEHYPAETYFRLSKFENDPSVFLLHKFPAIYPILSITDIYLGDFSSIGYDFLIMDKPMFFLIPDHNLTGDLHTCGMIIPNEKIACLDKFIRSNLELCKNKYAQARRDLYTFSFGWDCNLIGLKNE